MTKWHQRYGGPGVMIYWHVERPSTCIYSQLKSSSSSEVAAMIEGLLRHCTHSDDERRIDTNYVDTPRRLGRRVRLDRAPRLPAVAPAEEHPLHPPLPPRRRWCVRPAWARCSPGLSAGS